MFATAYLHSSRSHVVFIDWLVKYGDYLPITSSQFADREEHVVLACFGTGKIMDGTGQGKMVFFHITDHIGESMIAVAFGIEVFISGNDPFDPSPSRHDTQQIPVARS